MGEKKRFSYLILGAGKQGTAAAYDVLRFGEAENLTLADESKPMAQAARARLRRVAGRALEKVNVEAAGMDARSPSQLRRMMRGQDAVLSALPYYFNDRVAACAIASRTSYCDLGGYFAMTRKILALDGKAKRAGVTVVPDCGVSPGMCNSLALAGIEQLDRTRDVDIYCGGLPQEPRPPLDYRVVFNLEGVLGNYLGEAYVLRGGKVALAEPFSGRELVDFGKPLGKLEAAVTGGATSTCPWTYRGKIQNYVYKTLRYPGHWDKIRLLRDLGLLDLKTVRVNGARVIPRQVFVACAGPRLAFPKDRDLLLLRVCVRGRKAGKDAEIVYTVQEKDDPRTGFTSMQRTTGFSAAVVLEMLAQGRVRRRGVVPLEKAVTGQEFLSAIRRRGIAVREQVRGFARGGRP